jgi:hypothetical protein
LRWPRGSIAALPTGDRRVGLSAETGEHIGDLDRIRERAGGWIDYVAGTAWALQEAGVGLAGFVGLLASDLPTGSGLSSSAALELASAWALAGDGPPALDPLALARVAQRGENGYVGVQSGLMDQFASSCGVAGAAPSRFQLPDWAPGALPSSQRAQSHRPTVAPAFAVITPGSPSRLGFAAATAAARGRGSDAADVTAAMFVRHGDRPDEKVRRGRTSRCETTDSRHGPWSRCGT